MIDALLVIFDAIAFLATVASASFLIAGWRRVPWLDVKLVLAGILGIVVAAYVAYGFEQLGLSTAFRVIFENIQVLLPLLWMFLLAGVLQGRSTEKLAANEQTLYQLIEGMPVGVVVSDRAGQPVFLNDIAHRITGLQTDSGGSLLDYISRNKIYRAGTDDLYPIEAMPLFKALEGKTAEVDDVEVMLGGKRVQIQAWCAPILDKAGNVEYAIAAFDDITERRATEQRVRESEALYRTLAEYSSAGVWHITPDGYTLYTNPAMRALLEVDATAELEGIRYHEFFSEESLRFVTREYEERQSGQALSFELELRGRRGGKAQVLISGAPLLDARKSLTGFIGTFVDISPLKEAEASLQNEQEFFDIAMNCMPGVFFVADAEARLLRWNENLLAILDIRADSLEEDSPLRFIPDQSRALFRQNLKEIFVKGAYSFESVLLAADGAELRYFFTGRRFIFRETPCIIVTGIDISERKQAQAERENLEHQLQHAQKMESIGLLAGGVAHDFNNLLVAILGYCDLIKNALGQSHPVYAELLQIERAGEQASGLTSQLLAFSRKQILQPKIFDLNAVVYETEKMLDRLLGETVTIQCRLDDNLPTIRADRGQIEQLLVNLAINARDAMPRGGVLLFATELAELTARDLGMASDLRPGMFVHLAVVDTGCGMSPEVRERMFDPFFTTKPSGKGTGLGLSTVYGIVRQSGGDIRVDSADGKGSAFHIYLPVCEEEDEEDTDTTAGTAHVPHGETILVAEDAEAPRELICRILSEKGYRVLSAESAAAAIELAEEYAGKIDVLLTDIVMPGDSGQELAQRLRERMPALNVMYMTGYTDNELVRQDALDGSIVLLQKPFTPDELLAHLDTVLRQSDRVMRG